MADFLAVLTTTDDKEKAQNLGASAVGKRLAACAQIDGPVGDEQLGRTGSVIRHMGTRSPVY
ncbi:divalent cation tolerance protein CutA [Streptomyces sp. NBC_01716]|uniref:divalent cation tolerance protein CutA n=1 Tax=Streptomyces sp. NBC_01716 TaxID=2975917 RepID=UPI003FCEC7F1